MFKDDGEGGEEVPRWGMGRAGCVCERDREREMKKKGDGARGKLEPINRKGVMYNNAPKPTPSSSFSSFPFTLPSLVLVLARNDLH